MAVSAKFIAGADTVKMLPQSSLPEVALLGRSNVGKSTFINRLVNQRGLARTSNTPGRTQEVNIFEVNFSDGQRRDKPILLADLPGYGYAKLPKSKRESLNELIVSYLEHRRNLSLIILLNDVRRNPESQELFIKKTADEAKIPCLIVLTKSDKLSNNQRIKAVNEIASVYGVEAESFVISGEKVSSRDIWPSVLSYLP